MPVMEIGNSECVQHLASCLGYIIVGFQQNFVERMHEFTTKERRTLWEKNGTENKANRYDIVIVSLGSGVSPKFKS